MKYISVQVFATIKCNSEVSQTLSLDTQMKIQQTFKWYLENVCEIYTECISNNIDIYKLKSHMLNDMQPFAKTYWEYIIKITQSLRTNTSHIYYKDIQQVHIEFSKAACIVLKKNAVHSKTHIHTLLSNMHRLALQPASDSESEIVIGDKYHTMCYESLIAHLKSIHSKDITQIQNNIAQIPNKHNIHIPLKIIAVIGGISMLITLRYIYTKYTTTEEVLQSEEQ